MDMRENPSVWDRTKMVLSRHTNWSAILPLEMCIVWVGRGFELNFLHLRVNLWLWKFLIDRSGMSDIDKVANLQLFLESQELDAITGKYIFQPIYAAIATWCNLLFIYFVRKIRVKRYDLASEILGEIVFILSLVLIIKCLLYIYSVGCGQTYW